MSLRFVYRTGCSLCDAMWHEWRAFLSGLDERQRASLPEVECIDLSEHPDLEQRYGQHVPLLELDGRPLCRYFFDAQALAAYLS